MAAPVSPCAAGTSSTPIPIRLANHEGGHSDAHKSEVRHRPLGRQQAAEIIPTWDGMFPGIERTATCGRTPQTGASIVSRNYFVKMQDFSLLGADFSIGAVG